MTGCCVDHFCASQVLTFDNWADVMHEAMSKVSPWSALYFVAVIVIGNYMILNLFLAILLDNFGVVRV